MHTLAICFDSVKGWADLAEYLGVKIVGYHDSHQCFMFKKGLLLVVTADQ